MPLSADPEKRAKQLEALAEGRRVAKERRAEGLPTKRTEQAGSRRRVVKGSYPASPAKQPVPPAPHPAPPATSKGEPTHGPTEEEPAKPAKPARRDWLGAIARIVDAG